MVASSKAWESTAGARWPSLRGPVLTTRCQPTPWPGCPSVSPGTPPKPAPGRRGRRTTFRRPSLMEDEGRRPGPASNFKRKRDAAAPRPGADALAGTARPVPATATVPEQRADAPSHPTPQSRHPAADTRRTHAPEVTQHSKQKRERGGAQGAPGFMVTPPAEDAVAIGQAEWAGPGHQETALTVAPGFQPLRLRRRSPQPPVHGC